MEINWKQKLTSRKFWAAVVGFITTLLVAFGVADLQIEQVIAVITASATLIAYIIGEGLVDKARVEKENLHTEEQEKGEAEWQRAEHEMK